MIAFDESEGRLCLSLEDLLTEPGDSAIDPDTQRSLGAEAREAYRANAPGPAPQLDVPLGLEFEWRDLHVRIDATLDAVHAGRRGDTVELLHCAPLSGGAAIGSPAVEKVGLACLLLQRSGRNVRKGTLAEIALDGAVLARVDVAFAPDVYERLLDRRLERAVTEQRAHRGLARARVALAEKLEFPFASSRAGQSTLLNDVAGAAGNGLTLLCAAPTGIGKTVATLYPMLREALRADRQLFFATGKVSQQELALQTLSRLLPPDSPGFAVQISAKHRMCPSEELGCADRRCPLLEGFRERARGSGLLDTLAREGVVTGARLRETALTAKLCPFEVSLALASRAVAVVADFNYVFDPGAYLKDLLDEPRRAPLLIVDEAHGLPDRARDYYSPELDFARLEALAADCRSTPGGSYAQAAKILSEASAHARGHVQRLADERDSPDPWADPPERSFWQGLEPAARAALASYAIQRSGEHERPRAFQARRSPGDPRPRDPLVEALRGVRDFARLASGDLDSFAALWRPDRVQLLCLDAAPFLRPRFDRFHAVVCMSATLTPPGFYERTLGVEGPGTERLDLASPFPAENRLLLCVPGVDTTYRRRSEDAPQVARIIARCLRVRPGNYLAFFGSYQYRDEVVAHLSPNDARVLLQLPGMPAEPILRQLERNRDGTLLVCAVHGGVLAEGVDYPGELAVGVFVVGPGLPGLSPERELIRDHYQNHLGAGFEFAYVFPGLSRVVQAAGRAIRTPSDRAALLLLGRRFTEPLYRERLPDWWREELIDARDPIPALEEFWARGSGEAPHASGAASTRPSGAPRGSRTSDDPV